MSDSHTAHRVCPIRTIMPIVRIGWTALGSTPLEGRLHTWKIPAGGG